VEHWLETSVLPAGIAAGLLLLVLWPTEHSGKRLLRTWGIPEPQPAQIKEAVRYLRQRRILYVAFFLLIPSLSGLIGQAPGVAFFVPLLLAMLIAEVVATLRPVSGVRSASLDRRSWRDLVPRWAGRTLAAGAALTVVFAVAGIVAGPGYAWLALGYVAVCVPLVAGLVALAVRRPAVADEAVDAALRTRTARVAVGIGFGWLATAFSLAAGHLRTLTYAGPGTVTQPAWQTGWVIDALDIGETLVVIMALVCWMWVAMPTRRSLATTR
jgi:hypothetical protein